MDRVKPIDLTSHSIEIVRKGYRKETVDILLDQSAKEIEDLLMHERQLKQENDHLRNEIERFRSIESSLKDALILAQKAADETRANAHKQAELIVDEARRKASDEQHNVTKEVQSLVIEIDLLKREKVRFLTEFRTLLQNHLREMEEQQPVPTVVPTVAQAVVEVEPVVAVSEPVPTIDEPIATTGTEE